MSTVLEASDLDHLQLCRRGSPPLALAVEINDVWNGASLKLVLSCVGCGRFEAGHDISGTGVRSVVAATVFRVHASSAMRLQKNCRPPGQPYSATSCHLGRYFDGTLDDPAYSCVGHVQNFLQTNHW